MKRSDITRDTFRPEKNYTGVRMQQGRVQLDADWNEQIDLQLRRERQLAADCIGGAGAPASDGLAIMPIKNDEDLSEAPLPYGTTIALPTDLRIQPGRFYLKGMEIEVVEECRYTTQPHYPGAKFPTLDPSKVYLVYLEAWEREVTQLEDSSLREVALGGPDTATRLQQVWQIKIEATEPGKLQERYYALNSWLIPPVSPPAGLLRPSLSDTTGAALENRLYRIEIVDGGSLDKATFRWSRDNGAVVARVNTLGNALRLDTPVSFDTSALVVDQWLELTSESRELRGEKGTYVQISSVSSDGLQVKGDMPVDLSPGELIKARLWNAAPDQTVYPIPIRLPDPVNNPAPKVSDWMSLESGIKVRFELPANAAADSAAFVSGDSWTLPARQLLNNLDWPADTSGNLLPRPGARTEHQSCVLAVIMKTPGSPTAWDYLHLLSPQDSVVRPGLAFLQPLQVPSLRDLAIKTDVKIVTNQQNLEKKIDAAINQLKIHAFHFHAQMKEHDINGGYYFTLRLPDDANFDLHDENTTFIMQTFLISTATTGGSEYYYLDGFEWYVSRESKTNKRQFIFRKMAPGINMHLFGARVDCDFLAVMTLPKQVITPIVTNPS